MTKDGTWMNYMCHNLGADTNLDPMSFVVGNPDGSGGTLGWLFQWGRPADGHQLRNSTAGTGANQYDPNWSSGNWNDILKTANDPCPEGWKVPDPLNWDAIPPLSWTGKENNGIKINNYLFLPTNYPGQNEARYWTDAVSTVAHGNPAYMLFYKSGDSYHYSIATWTDFQSARYSVRCVADKYVEVPGKLGKISLLRDTAIALNESLTVSMPAVVRATSYRWILPAGLSASSLTTTEPSITVTGNGSEYNIPQTIQVVAVNDHGESPETRASGGYITVYKGCGAYTNPGVWTVFMCHNLGADETSDPFTPSYQTNGAYYQWGSHDAIIGNPNSDGTDPVFTWSTSAPSGKWGPDNTKSVDDPCPDGWRVPSSGEWDSLFALYGPGGSRDHLPNVMTIVGNSSWVGMKIGPALMLPFAGYRVDTDGSLSGRGSSGNYWSPVAPQNMPFAFGASLNSGTTNGYGMLSPFVPTNGLSVRCIAE